MASRPGELKLTGAVLADIYLGKIQNWSDPAIKAINAGLALPDLKITVVHRSDGSGSTFNWTSFLSAVSPDWKTKYGADTLISWPLGANAEGSSGMVARSRRPRAPSAMSNMARSRAPLSIMPRSRIRAGQFVKPEPAAFEAAAAKARLGIGQGLLSLARRYAEREAAYPITAVTFVLMRRRRPRHRGSTRRSGSSATRWTRARADAARLGYVPLPERS